MAGMLKRATSFTSGAIDKSTKFFLDILASSPFGVG